MSDSKARGKAQRIAGLKAQAWRMRSRGRTQATIAADLGVDQSTVSRWLADIQRKELARLSEAVERHKVTQTAQLETLIEELWSAWEQSKQPRTRVTERKTGETLMDANGKPVLDSKGKPVMVAATVTEAIQQTGDPAYVDRVFVALASIRKLWGLDVAEADNAGGVLSFAERVRELKQRAERFDALPAPKAEGKGKNDVESDG